MKIKDITDIAVTIRAENAAIINWNADGLRYHMTVTRDTLEVTEGFMTRGKKVIYCNPVADYGKPGWFRTRTLNAESASNAKVVRHLIDYVVENRMIEIAAERLAQSKADEEAATRARVISGVTQALTDNGIAVGDLSYETAIKIMSAIRGIK